MIVLRALLGSRSAFEEIRERSLWLPFFLFAAAPVAITVLAIPLLGAKLPSPEGSRLPQSLLLLGIGLGVPIAWAARCAGTALLLSWSGTLLGTPARLAPLLLASAAASAAPSLKGLLQSAVTLGFLLAGRGTAPILDDSLALAFPDGPPQGAVGALVSSLGVFEAWFAILLVLAVATATGCRAQRAAVQVLPVWLGTAAVASAGRILIERAG